MIYETIVTTLTPDGAPYFAPMGVRREALFYVIAPFRPSRTLDHVLSTGHCVINTTDDVRLFAGFETGRRSGSWWQTCTPSAFKGVRLAQALAHVALEVVRFEDDAVRPRVVCRARARETHAPFAGFNRAQAAVVEASILASRLRRLAPDEVAHAMDFLRPLVEKTGGAREREAWGWLEAHIGAHRAARAR